jgi:N-acetylmuramoyl-L-alanine amidase
MATPGTVRDMPSRPTPADAPHRSGVSPSERARRSPGSTRIRGAAPIAGASGATPARASTRRLAAGGLALAVAVGLLPGAAAGASPIEDTISSLAVAPRVLTPDGDGVDDELVAGLVLARPATVSATVVDYAGAPVETLLPASELAAGETELRWDGRRSGSATLVPNAGYRLRLDIRSDLGVYRVERPFVKATRAIYPANPGAIVIALDPGHGGRDPGAVSSGVVEKQIALDVARRLRAMLEGAGVRVAMTRAGDTLVNVSARDLDGDRRVGARDELASRIEVANAAAADVLLSIHVNSAFSHYPRGVETWYTRDRPFAAANRQLATLVQASLVSGLGEHRTRSWRPVNRGTRRVQFYLLGEYQRRTRPRPSLMPGVLSELLFVSNRGDRAVLRSPARRQRIAEAYYDALATYLGARAAGARYSLVGVPPAQLVEGTEATLQLEVTNTSRSRWAAETAVVIASWLPSVPFYDGSGAPGTTIGATRLPELAPGASAVVDLTITAPAYARVAAKGGRALLKIDLGIGGRRLSRLGVVPLQRPLRVLVAPAPSPTPDPGSSGSPVPPSAEPSVPPSAEPSVPPSAEPSEPAASPVDPTPTPAP